MQCPTVRQSGKSKCFSNSGGKCQCSDTGKQCTGRKAFGPSAGPDSRFTVRKQGKGGSRTFYTASGQSFKVSEEVLERIAELVADKLGIKKRAALN